MGKDISWKAFLSDDERYADLINGIGCNGRQAVSQADLYEIDTQTGVFTGLTFLNRLPTSAKRRSIKNRDTIRKAAFGINFAIIGIESQEEIDYEIPLRNMSYDAGEYEKQAAKIRRDVRKNHTGLAAGEYLYGFRKDSRLYPVITFILYTGIKPWDGPRILHDILDFTDIPKELQNAVPNYKMNLIEVRKWEDTAVFKTDVRQVFDFIRYSEDKNALKQLVEKDAYYKQMEEDAFDVVAYYVNAKELAQAKNYHRKDGKVDMCTAIKELIADGKAEGIAEGREKGKAEGIAEGREKGKAEERTEIIRNMIKHGMSDKDIRSITACEQELIDSIRRTLFR